MYCAVMYGCLPGWLAGRSAGQTEKRNGAVVQKTRHDATEGPKLYADDHSAEKRTEMVPSVFLGPGSPVGIVSSGRVLYRRGVKLGERRSYAEQLHFLERGMLGRRMPRTERSGTSCAFPDDKTKGWFLASASIRGDLTHMPAVQQRDRSVGSIGRIMKAGRAFVKRGRNRKNRNANSR